jgi:hypothetical protein
MVTRYSNKYGDGKLQNFYSTHCRIFIQSVHIGSGAYKAPIKWTVKLTTRLHLLLKLPSFQHVSLRSGA